jgi:hypothetical protein
MKNSSIYRASLMLWAIVLLSGFTAEASVSIAKASSAITVNAGFETEPGISAQTRPNPTSETSQPNPTSETSQPNQNSETSRTDTPYRTEIFSVNSGGSLTLQTSGGNLQVTGSSSDQVIVEMFVRRNGRNILPADSDLRNFAITIEQRGSQILAKAERDSRNSNILTSTNESISFVVSVPNRYNVDMSTSGGTITLSDVAGELKGRTSGGSINLSDLTGTIEMRTSGGNISFQNLTGDVTTSTSGGNIRANNSQGNIRLSTSGGSIRLDDVGGAVNASTSGGNVNAKLTEITGPISLRTSGGGITADLPGSEGLTMNVRGSRVRMPLINFNGESKTNEIIGTINGGGHPVEIRTSGGNVTINFN